MPRKKVLITVTTYPLPSRSYDELVCTAGVLEDGSWIRIYPIPLSFLKELKVNGKIINTKYTWIELDLKERTDDFRTESHSPADYEFKDMVIYERLGTDNFWAARKQYCLKNVYTDLTKLINDSKEPKNTSLATFKPKEILDFVIKETDSEWKDTWKAQFQALRIDFDKVEGEGIKKDPPPKVPYEFSYTFVDENGKQSTLMIEDWEIGQLYWNCLERTGDEQKACAQVKQKYFDEFKSKHDIYLFLGTTKTHHMKRARNPFVIIGVFYPLKNFDTQVSLW